MADRAAVLAAFLRSDEGRAHRDEDALLAACVSRWPDLTVQQFGRGVASAKTRGRVKAASDCPHVSAGRNNLHTAVES